MCSRLRVALLALMLATAPLGAQSSVPDASERGRLEAELARLDARIEVLSERIEARSRTLDERLEAEALERAARQIGPFSLEGTEAMLRAAAPALEREWLDLAEQLGELSFIPTMRIELVDSDRINAADLVAGATHRRVSWSNRYPGTSNVLSTARSMVRDALPARLVSWTQGNGLTRRADPRLGYQSLLTTTHPQGISCVQESDLDACARFLFLEYDGSPETNQAALAEWYMDSESLDSAPLKRAAARTAGYHVVSRARVCRDSEFDRSACIGYLSQPRFILNVAPSSSATRGALMQRALDLDPDGRGLLRVAALPSNASVAEQLEAVSGVSAPELVRQWREGLTVSNQLAELGNGGPGPFTLLWAGAFALLSLRSTRWRLG